jgi:hypothetical protein
MRKFFLTLILLSVPASTGALAHSGTDQEQQACTRDVQRFCRKLMDQGDFTVLACLKENCPKLSSACCEASDMTVVSRTEPSATEIRNRIGEAGEVPYSRPN